jgi:hypothetical protein
MSKVGSFFFSVYIRESYQQLRELSLLHFHFLFPSLCGLSRFETLKHKR